MRTNIDLDDNLVKEAMELTSIKTKKEVVSLALKELISMYKRKSLLHYRGKFKWEGDLDVMRKTR